MKKGFTLLKLLITLITLFVAYTATAQSTIIPDRATKIIDGSMDDWSLPLRFYDKDAHLQYALANNDSMLYICFRITEVPYQMKLIKGGMTIYIDTTGKKREDISITCPIPENIGSIKHLSHEDKPLLNGSEPASTSGKMQNRITEGIQLAFSEYNLIGFPKEGIFNNMNVNQDIKIAASLTDFNALIIEYSIRINSFYKPLLKTNPNKKISLTFVINGVPEPPSHTGSPMEMSKMRGMQGGNGSIRPPMNRTEPNSYHDLSITQTTRTKIKMILNQEKLIQQ